MRDDNQIIDATLAGDSAAFGELVAKYQDRLYHTLVHLVGSAEDAKDVVQEAFVQAFVKLDGFQGSSAFYTWLYRIAFNNAMSLRRRARPTLSLDQAGQLAEVQRPQHDVRPDSRLLTEERAGQVQAALATLSDEHRTVLILREIEDYSYDVIADILQLPVGTVRSRLHRARSQMCAALKNVLQEETGP